MNKQEFLDSLRKSLSVFPEDETNDYIEYYSEMIDDRIEEGRSEEEAVADIGTAEDIASRIISQSSFPKLIKAKLTPKRKLKTWEIVLIALGSPVWASALITLFAVLIAILASAFAAIVSLYASAFAMILSVLGGVCGFISNIILGNCPLGFTLLGCGLVGIGMGILLLIFMNRLTMRLFSLIKKLVIKVKSHLMRKEESE